MAGPDIGQGVDCLEDQKPTWATGNNCTCVQYSHSIKAFQHYICTQLFACRKDTSTLLLEHDPDLVT
jgi:hypothetical protein